MTKINEFNAFDKIFKHHSQLNNFFNAHKTLISLELDLTNLCDGRCPKCTGIKDKPVSLSFEQVKRLTDELADVFKAKSVIISGGGEPLLHPDFIRILNYIKGRGLKIGLNSNGLSLNEDKAKAILDSCTYFRVSLDAGTPEMYKKTHGLGRDAFDRVVGNIRMFSSLKTKAKSHMAWGTGFLTSNDTKKDILQFVKLSKECGVDFAQMRPFTQDFTPIDSELAQAKSIYEDDKFKVSASRHKYERFEDADKRPYKRCPGMFFNSVVTADFRVFACLHHRQNEKYLLGDLNKTTLKEIWTSSRIREVYQEIDLGECPLFCRNDDINRGLAYLDKPVNHCEFL
jgi:MoaA/NifB/PqqE/SkfB family radical SAM enzyme